MVTDKSLRWHFFHQFLKLVEGGLIERVDHEKRRWLSLPSSKQFLLLPLEIDNCAAISI